MLRVRGPSRAVAATTADHLAVRIALKPNVAAAASAIRIAAATQASAMEGINGGASHTLQQTQAQPQRIPSCRSLAALAAAAAEVAATDSREDAEMIAPEQAAPILPSLAAPLPPAAAAAAVMPAAAPAIAISPTLDSSSDDKSEASAAAVDDRMMDAHAEAKEEKPEQSTFQVPEAVASAAAPPASAASASPALLPASSAPILSSLRPRLHRKSYKDESSDDEGLFQAALVTSAAAAQKQPERSSNRLRTRSSSGSVSSSSSGNSSSNKKQSKSVKEGAANKSSKRAVPLEPLPAAAPAAAMPSPRKSHRNRGSKGSSEEAKAATHAGQHEERKRKKAKHEQPAQSQMSATAASVISAASAAASAASDSTPVRQSERAKLKKKQALESAASLPNASSKPSSGAAAAASAVPTVSSKSSKLKPLALSASAASAASVASTTEAAPSSAELKPKIKSAKATAVPKSAQVAGAASVAPASSASRSSSSRHLWACQHCRTSSVSNFQVDANLDACPRCGEKRSEESKKRSAAALAAAAARKAERRELASAPSVPFSAASASIAPIPVASKFAFNLSPEPAVAKAAAAAPTSPSWMSNAIHVSPGWKLIVTDVCIVGGGAAGLQCAEHLSRCAKTRPASRATTEPLASTDEAASAAAGSSSASSAAASAAASASSPPIDILVLEGRNRVGGRIDSVAWRTNGREIAVERGAAYVHGFNAENLAARLAVRYNIHRRQKNDYNEAWFESGERLPDWLVLLLREMIKEINARMMRQAQQLAQTMTEHTEQNKQRRRAGEDADPATANPAAAALLSDPPPAAPARAWLESLNRLAAPARSTTDDQDMEHELEEASPAPPPPHAEIVDLTELSSESDSSQTSSSSNESDSNDTSSSDSEEDSESNRGERIASRPSSIAPRAPLAAPLPASDAPVAMELSSPPPSAAASVISGSVATPNDSAASSESSNSAASAASEELHSPSPMPSKLVLSAPVTRKRRRISESSTSSSHESKQASDGAKNDAAIAALLKEDALAPLPRRVTRGMQRPQAAPPRAPITKPPIPARSAMAYAAVAPTLRRFMREPAPRASNNSLITAYHPELDCSVQQLFDEALKDLMQDPNVAATLTPHLRSILFHIQSIVAGYICPLSQLSAFDMTIGSANTGGDRSLLGGYATVLQALLKRLMRRSKRGQCGFRVLKEHTVNCIEQMEQRDQAVDVAQQPLNEAASSSSAASAAASSSERPSYALISCPNQRVIVAARFVVITASIGILQSSIRFESQLAQRHAQLLQPDAQRRREAAKTETLKQPRRARAASMDFVASAAASVVSSADEKNSESNGAAAAAAVASASASSNAVVAPCPAYLPAFPFIPPPDIPGPQIYQLEAGILFEPQLSDSVREAVETRGMGLENKIILQFPEGSRFWPKNHMLHPANYPMYRFYNLDGIRDEPCDILVAHLPPPYAQELEHLPLAEVQRRVMTVLRDMFSTSRNGGPERTQQFNSENKVLDTYSGDEIGSEFELSDSSGDEEDQRQRREVRQLKIVRTRADKQVRSSDPSKQRQRALARAGAFRADNAWKTKPVVLPLRIEITKWGQDPFAQGAYSCIPVGCNLKMVHRLQQPEPSGSESGRAGVLYFAGEATDTQDNQQVHGAMKSGARAATQIWKRIQQQQM